MTSFISAVKSFILTSKTNCDTLSGMIETASGINILCHSVENATLPTWHRITIPDPAAERAVNSITTQDYAQAIHFQDDIPAFENVNIARPAAIDPALYLIGNAEYDPDHPAILADLFDKERNVNPAVLWFMPYGKEPEQISYSTVLGLKIESVITCGVTISVPNPHHPLRYNNSGFQQGSIPLNAIRPVIPTLANDDAIIIPRREYPTRRDQICGIAVRNMTFNLVPRFATNANRETIPTIYGLTRQTNFTYSDYGYSYTGWYSGKNTSMRSNRVYLWSSYRWVQNPLDQTRQVSFYSTLRS